jgi:hypothetical protein
MIARRLILKDNHPTMVKLDKLFGLAEELGLSFSFHHYGTSVHDSERDSNLPELIMLDADHQQDEGVMDFPPTLEFKLVYDNPAYLAEQKRLNYELVRANLEKKRLEDEAWAKKLAQEKELERIKQERLAQEKEIADRALYLELKARFET